MSQAKSAHESSTVKAVFIIDEVIQVARTSDLLLKLQNNLFWSSQSIFTSFDQSPIFMLCYKMGHMAKDYDGKDSNVFID